MKLLCSLLLLALIGLVRLGGAPTNKSVEDDLDAIVPPKKSDAAKAQVDPMLDAFVLKPNPTAKDAARYLGGIINAMTQKLDDAMAQARNTSGRFQISISAEKLSAKLNAIPSVFIDEMIQQDDGSAKHIPTLYRSTMVSSINGRQDLNEAQREVILKALPSLPALIETVTKQGWEKGAEATIVKTVKQGKITYSTPFVAVLATYGTPAANKALIELLTHARPQDLGKNLTALSQATVPGLDLNDIVTKAWKNAQDNGDKGPTSIAPIAAKYGHLDALLYLTKRINGAPNPYDKSDNAIRANFLDSLQQLVPDGGSDEKSLVKYILANRTKLIFDPTLKEFHLPK